MRKLDKLIKLIDTSYLDGWELYQNSRAIIDVWLENNLPYPNEYLDPIVGIESEADKLSDPTLRGNLIFDQEAKSIFSFYDEIYRQKRLALRKFLLEFYDIQ